MKIKAEGKRHFQQNIGRGALGLLLMQVIACNPSSERLKKYSDVQKTFGPVHDVNLPVQDYARSDLYNIEIDPNTAPIFIAGQRTSIIIHTSLNLPKVRYALVSNDLPRGSEALKPIGNGDWELSWTPPKDILPENLNDHPIYNFHLALSIEPSDNPQIQNIISTLATERVFHYSVLRPTAAPEIVEIKGVEAYPGLTKLNEGDIKAITISVKDPSSSTTQKPKLLLQNLQTRVSKEQQVLNGNAFLFINTEPKQVGPDLWQFQASFDTKNNPVPEFEIPNQDEASPSIQANVSFQILSANRTLSPEQNLSFEITYRRELLKPNILLDPQLEAHPQAQTWIEKFKVTMPSKVGDMSVYVTPESSSISPDSPPQIHCSQNGSSSRNQDCQLTWKIPCDFPVGEYKIQIVAVASYEENEVRKDIIKSIRVTDSDVKCRDPKGKPVAKATKSASTSKVEPQAPASNETAILVEPIAPAEPTAAVSEHQNPSPAEVKKPAPPKKATGHRNSHSNNSNSRKHKKGEK